MCDVKNIAAGGITPTDCWRKCTASDVLTPKRIAYIKEAVQSYIGEIENYLRVRPRASGAKFKFKKGLGTYLGYYATKVKNIQSYIYSSYDISIEIPTHLCAFSGSVR